MYSTYRLRKGRVSKANHYYAITLVCHSRKNYFNNLFINRQIIREMQNVEQENLLISNTFVVMPNHLHWLFQLSNILSLSEVVRIFKGRTAALFRKHFKQRLWQKGFYDHQIRNEEDLVTNARYIVANPLRAGIISNLADYPYWDSIYVKP
ncbi:transposase [Pseudoalteromonas sp. BZP1]|jgi:REP element-mobilizing transposase RayT|uniref:REP-associated tyrosine transposase n=1 Tax=unclassified Pseudoalteromonas TaxID=194690 RepID=UPI002594E39B|nr:transposase [uncultured Pseudoalteromonas sp.]